MKHLFVSTLFATLLFIMAQACSGDKVVLTKEHNGNKVALKSDDALVVQLPGALRLKYNPRPPSRPSPCDFLLIRTMASK